MWFFWSEVAVLVISFKFALRRFLFAITSSQLPLVIYYNPVRLTFILQLACHRFPIL